MAIQFDSNLPPLHPKVPPAVPIDTLLAIDRVTLTASDVPRGILREFYTRTLGLTFVQATDDLLEFTYLTRQIILDRNMPDPGRLGLLIRGFSDALLRLRERSIHYQLLHTDSGLTRMAIVRDAAGNWIHLLETRPF
jgi:hypothetical protein